MVTESIPTNTQMLRKQAEKALASVQAAYNEKMLALDQYGGVIDLLPRLESLWDNMYPIHGQVCIAYWPFEGRDPEDVRAQVQQVLNIPAKREFNSIDGTAKYKFITEHFRITIFGGKVSPVCKVTPYRETVTRYKIECPEGADADGTAE